jgi:prephenate dehydrogenase
MEQVAGVTFQRQMNATREVVSENPSLYFEIQALNSLTTEIADSLKRATEDWLDAIQGDDAETFSALMEQCRDYFSDIGEGDRTI